MILPPIHGECHQHLTISYLDLQVCLFELVFAFGGLESAQTCFALTLIRVFECDYKHQREMTDYFARMTLVNRVRWTTPKWSSDRFSHPLVLLTVDSNSLSSGSLAHLICFDLIWFDPTLSFIIIVAGSFAFAYGGPKLVRNTPENGIHIIFSPFLRRCCFVERSCDPPRSKVQSRIV